MTDVIASDQSHDRSIWLFKKKQNKQTGIVSESIWISMGLFCFYHSIENYEKWLLTYIQYITRMTKTNVRLCKDQNGQKTTARRRRFARCAFAYRFDGRHSKQQATVLSNWTPLIIIISVNNMLMTNEDIQIVSQLEMDMLFLHEHANDDFVRNNINDQNLGIEMRILAICLFIECVRLFFLAVSFFSFQKLTKKTLNCLRLGSNWHWHNMRKLLLCLYSSVE